MLDVFTTTVLQTACTPRALTGFNSGHRNRTDLLLVMSQTRDHSSTPLMRLQRIELCPTAWKAVMLPEHLKRLVAPEGFEPSISGFKAQHTWPLYEGAVHPTWDSNPK